MPSQVPVAASGLLAEVLHGAPVDALVVASGRAAAYLTHPARGGDRVVAVVSRRATCPASGLVLPDGRSPADLLPVGARVRVGDGALQAPTHRLVVGRWFLPAAAPRRGSPDPDALAAARTALAQQRVPAEVALARRDGARAADELVRGDDDRAAELLVGLLGRGPGLTPTGDDVVAGVLLASRSVLEPERLERVARTVLAGARLATTVVSRGMLADAAAGWCPDVVARGVAGLLTPRPAGSGTAVADLLRVGHTSGGDLLSGAAGALEASARAQVA
jgi:hypothetical protein